MGDEEVSAVDGEVVREAHGVPAPKQPTREQVARHNINHLPYRSWCPHCVAARRPNASHKTNKSAAGRAVPLFCADYAFIRKLEVNLSTVLVGKLYPSQAVFASVCDRKGPDDPVVDRLADFLRSSGIRHLVYKSDQEASLKATIEKSLEKIDKPGMPTEGENFLQLVPESSAVGESASNGKAERTVQAVEDMVRTYLSALEGRLQAQVKSNSPVVRWMVEHAASMLNRFTTNSEGVTPYAALHGRNSTERHIEFGEKVFYFVPRKARTKLCLRWRLGTYLGVAPSANECYIANVDGDIVRSRSVARVVEASRWDIKAIENIRGLPGQSVVIGPANSSEGHIEETLEPHVDADHEDRNALDIEDDRKRKNAEDTRITMKDLRTYGFHPGSCLRCDDCRRGIANSWRRHSDECRWRVYKAYRDAGDPKYQNVKHLFEDETKPVTEAGEVDLSGSPAAASSSAAREEVPAAPLSEIPLREDSNEIDDEPESRGRWNPDGYRPGELAEADANDPSIDMFLPDDEGDTAMDDEVTENQMADALLDAGVDAEVADNFMRAIMKRKTSRSTRTGGTKSDRAGDRHIERSERNSRTADPKAAPVAKSSKANSETTFVEVYGGGSFCKEAEQSRRNLNLKGLSAMDLRTLKPDGTPWNFCRRADRQEARRYIDKHDPD